MPQLAEKVVICKNYEDAAKAACAFVKKVPQPSEFVIYPSTVGPTRGQTVGCGIPGGGNNIKWLVRIDYDPSPTAKKGVHFNATAVAGTNDEKIAAVIQPTVDNPSTAEALFKGWLKELAKITNGYIIWNAWKEGRHPGAFCIEGSEGEDLD